MIVVANLVNLVGEAKIVTKKLEEKRNEVPFRRDSSKTVHAVSFDWYIVQKKREETNKANNDDVYVRGTVASDCEIDLLVSNIFWGK